MAHAACMLDLRYIELEMEEGSYYILRQQSELLYILIFFIEANYRMRHEQHQK